MKKMNFKCRHCDEKLTNVILDLGNQPPSNSFLTLDETKNTQETFPLKVFVCSKCWLVQLPEYKKAKEIFSGEYVYLSSTSQTMLNHAREFSKNIINRLNLDQSSFVVEVASNDGYLLKNFVMESIPCLGIEPTELAGNIAIRNGINTEKIFFNDKNIKLLTYKYPKLDSGVDLVIANNVLAHVPDINSFIEGLFNIISPKGIISIEFPHLLQLINNNLFDTIYHEHFSYLSLSVVRRMLKKYGLDVFDIEELNVHGGSLRVFACREGAYKIDKSVSDFILLETNPLHGKSLESKDLGAYRNLQNSAQLVKKELCEYLYALKSKNKNVIGYGAAAKGNTLLNFCKINKELLSFVVDNAKSKQGKYLPGSHIPVIAKDNCNYKDIDSTIVLPWNLINEIIPLIDSKEIITAMPRLTYWRK